MQLINHKKNIYKIKTKTKNKNEQSSHCYFLLQATFVSMENDLSSEEDVYSLDGQTKKYVEIITFKYVQYPNGQRSCETHTMEGKNTCK